MTLQEHLALMNEMAEKWHVENDKPKSVRKAMRYIKQQKMKRGI